MRSLKVLLVFGFTAVALGTFFLTSTVLSRSTELVASTEANRRARELLIYSTEALSESVAAGDRLQVHLIGQALLNHGVAAIVIKNSVGEVLFSSELPQRLDRTPTSPQDEGVVETIRAGEQDYIHAASTIGFADKPVGSVRLWLDRGKLAQKIEETNSHIYPILIAGYAVLLLFGIFVLDSPFRALRRLEMTAERVAGGDLEHEVPVRGQDEVSSLCHAFNSMLHGLREARVDSFRRNLEAIQAMISAVEAKDSYTQGHCVRVRDYTRSILAAMPQKSSEDRFLIETAALLHDIGKIGIPDSILLKEDALDELEMAIVRTHVDVGEKILLHLESMKEVARWVRHHHERWDGLGYPDGLRGSAIPFPSRVISVADALDAMLTDRPYRRALSAAETIEALEGNAATQFDPEIVAVVSRLLAAEPEKVQVSLV